MSNTSLIDEFQFFKSEFELKPAERVLLGQLISPTKHHFSMGINTFYGAVTEVSGILFDRPTSWHGNLKSGRDVSSAKVSAVVFFIFKTYPNYFAKYQPDPKAADLQIHKNKPFWEIIESIPSLSELNALAPNASANLPPQHVGIFTMESKSVDDNTYLFGLSDHGQRTASGASVRVFLEMTISTAFDDGDYEYGFTSVRVRTNIKTNSSCDIRFDPKFNENASAGQNVTAKLTKAGPACFVDIEAKDDVLNGTYDIADVPFFFIKPADLPYEFSAEMCVQLREMNLAKADGSDLPSENKKAIIASLLAQEMIGGPPKNRWLVLARQKLAIKNTEVDDLFEYYEHE